MKYKLGIDVGGTFTDFIAVSGTGGTVVHKTPSTPEDPSIGVMKGLDEIADILQVSPSDFIRDIETIVHGTTVATNALLTLRGAKTALITTKGFRDALHMRRGIREEQYNNHYRNVPPLIPRYLRLTVDERIDAQGAVITPLNEDDVRACIDICRREGVESVAICFMNAFKDSRHEQRALELVSEQLPSCFVTASTDVLPSIRFYERLSTTAVNAYIGPVVARYIDNLIRKFEAAEYRGALLIMQSNGGVVTPEVVKTSPAVTVLSGPAAAPTAGVFYANLLGYKNCITVDMGGTSFDASLVIDNRSVTSTEGSINRYKIALPALDIETIGAGGGSIGWIDSGGLLHMGPQSAGAAPGPVCYDKGGTSPTCTDANLFLGYLDPEFFAGGKIRLNTERAREALMRELAAKLGLSLEATCSGMYRIINMNMAQGVRQVSIERGYDPREFLMIVAGGAGPIHAGEICKELEIPLFIVPDVASIFCAAGMLLGDLKHDYVASHLSVFSRIDRTRFLDQFRDMKAKGVDTLVGEGIPEGKIEFFPVLDVRYSGQYHEVQLPVPWEQIMAFDRDAIITAFHIEHNRLFGYSLEDEGTEIELINVRLRVTGHIEKPDFLQSSRHGGNGGARSVPPGALKRRRSAYIPESDSFEEVAVYDGDMPLHGCTIAGPAIIEKVNTSIFLGSSYDCHVDPYGTFVVYNTAVFPDGVRFDNALTPTEVHEHGR